MSNDNLGACCAHLVMNYATEPAGDGSVWGFWRCTTCSMEFVIQKRQAPTSAEPEAQAPSEAAPPVTDADVEAAMWRYRDAAISIGASGDGYGVLAEYGGNLRALIARRVQQAGAAAEELARAADDAVSVVEYNAGRFGEPPTECVRLSRERFDALRTALAAFRAAQGGSS